MLDTQAYLWSLSSDRRLTSEMALAIEQAHTTYLSVASVWEIAIKHGLGKLDTKLALPNLVRNIPLLKGMVIVPIEPNHVLRVARLPLHHRDPFDRMIVAQALEEGLPVVSGDAALDVYGIRRIF